MNNNIQMFPFLQRSVFKSLTGDHNENKQIEEAEKIDESSNADSTTISEVETNDTISSTEKSERTSESSEGYTDSDFEIVSHENTTLSDTTMADQENNNVAVENGNGLSEADRHEDTDKFPNQEAAAPPKTMSELELKRLRLR